MRMRKKKNAGDFSKFACELENKSKCVCLQPNACDLAALWRFQNPVCPKGGKRDITVNVECGGQYHLCARVYQLIG